jgi:type IV pilus assembly protein PilB
VPTQRKKLGEILVEMGAVDELQLQAGMGHHQQWGMRIGRALVERGFCRAEDVLRALSKQTGHPVIDLDLQPLDSRLVFTLNVKAAEKHRAVPLRLEGKRSEMLVVAVAGPAGMETMDAILAVSGKVRVIPYLADDEAIDRAIGKLYYNRQPGPPKAPPPQALNRATITGEQELELEQEPPTPPGVPAALASELLAKTQPRVQLAPAPQPSELLAKTQPSARMPPAQPQVVLLYGWKEGVAKALGEMLARAGVRSRVVEEDALMECTAEDTVFSTSLSLETVLPSRQRLQAWVIVAGMPEDEDMTQAKALGVNVYLRSPLNSEQLVRAVTGPHKKA